MPEPQELSGRQTYRLGLGVRETGLPSTVALALWVLDLRRLSSVIATAESAARAGRVGPMMPNGWSLKTSRSRSGFCSLLEGGRPRAALDDPDRLLPPLAALAKRHTHYGVEPHHFDSVGAALLHALAETSGSAFTPELRNAWEEAYALVASVMQRALIRAAAG
jgi:hypothetical protein